MDNLSKGVLVVGGLALAYMGFTWYRKSQEPAKAGTPGQAAPTANISPSSPATKPSSMQNLGNIGAGIGAGVGAVKDLYNEIWG